MSPTEIRLRQFYLEFTELAIEPTSPVAEATLHFFARVSLAVACGYIPRELPTPMAQGIQAIDKVSKATGKEIDYQSLLRWLYLAIFDYRFWLAFFFPIYLPLLVFFKLFFRQKPTPIRDEIYEDFQAWDHAYYCDEETLQFWTILDTMTEADIAYTIQTELSLIAKVLSTNYWDALLPDSSAFEQCRRLRIIHYRLLDFTAIVSRLDNLKLRANFYLYLDGILAKYRASQNKIDLYLSFDKEVLNLYRARSTQTKADADAIQEAANTQERYERNMAFLFGKELAAAKAPVLAMLNDYAQK